MDKNLMCPRSEICSIYRSYVDATDDDTLGIIQVSTIENQEFFICQAFSTVKKLIKNGTLPQEIADRLKDVHNCLLIYEANKMTLKQRHDI